MHECICSNCKNLKGIILEDGSVEEYDCSHGLPSDICVDCNESTCELTCANYISDDIIEEPVILKCDSCGKELKQSSGDNQVGKVSCFDCFLKNA